MSELTDFWLESYKKKRGCRYVAFSKTDGVILANLSKTYGEKTVRALIGKFLAIDDEPYLTRSGWDTKAFSSRARGLYVQHIKQYGEAAVEEANRKHDEVNGIKDRRVLTLLDRIGKGMR